MVLFQFNNNYYNQNIYKKTTIVNNHKINNDINIIIHFSTIQSRFNYLSNVLDSLAKQTTNIYKIIITTSIKDNRYNNHNILYDYCKKYEKSFEVYIQILDEYDFGSNNKIIGAIKYIKDNKIDDNYCVLICDDDLIYNNNLLLSYREMLCENKNIVYTHFRTDKPRLNNIKHHLQGADTYLLPQLFFEKTKLEDYINYLNLSITNCPSTFFQDDYVISFYLYKYANIDVKPVKNNKSYNESVCLRNIEQLHLSNKLNERENSTIKYFNSIM
jgi:ACT domain-containing protein